MQCSLELQGKKWQLSSTHVYSAGTILVASEGSKMGSWEQVLGDLGY